MSLMFTLTGKSSILVAHYFPTIDLNDDYELSLIDFETYYTIPNVNSSNNKFYFDKDDKKNVIPEGSFKVRDIGKYLRCEILNSRLDDVVARKKTHLKDEVPTSIRW
ncbi:hypothetical protein P5V15_015854 [Pogonomyrmex californicus]